MRAGQWMAEVLRVYFSSKLKKPWLSSISSTSPTVSAPPEPITAQPTSKPSMASSSNTSLSSSRASSKARSSASSRSTRVTPREEPLRTGLTNTG